MLIGLPDLAKEKKVIENPKQSKITKHLIFPIGDILQFVLKI